MIWRWGFSCIYCHPSWSKITLLSSLFNSWFHIFIQSYVWELTYRRGNLPVSLFLTHPDSRLTQKCLLMPSNLANFIARLCGEKSSDYAFFLICALCPLLFITGNWLIEIVEVQSASYMDGFEWPNDCIQLLCWLFMVVIDIIWLRILYNCKCGVTWLCGIIKERSWLLWSLLLYAAQSICN